MRRQHSIALAVLLLAVGLLGVGVVLWPREPAYQGRKLSRWLEDIGTTVSSEPVEKASNAVRQMGTNAIPGLLASIGAKDSRFKTSLMKLVGVQRLAKLGFAPAQVQRRRGLLAFQALGPAAKPAIPALIPVLNDGETSQYAAAVLCGLGLEGVSALTNACDNPDNRVRLALVAAVFYLVTEYRAVNQPRQTKADFQHWNEAMDELFVPVMLHYLEDKDPRVQQHAVHILGALRGQPERVVPALVGLLKDDKPSLRSAAVWALGCWGPRDKAALSALVEYARKAENKRERDEAIKALKAFDTEAVAKAGLE